jgi:hypothetical protein
MANAYPSFHPSFLPSFLLQKTRKQKKKKRAAEKRRELRTKDSIGRVHGHLILGGISNEPLCVGERHIAGSSAISLVVSDDLHTIMLPDTNAAVGGS